MTFPRRLILFAAGWLVLFSALATSAVRMGAWPELAPGTFRGVDLVAGVGFGIVLLYVLVRRKTKGL